MRVFLLRLWDNTSAYMRPSSITAHVDSKPLSGLTPLGDSVRQCQRSVMEVLLTLVKDPAFDATGNQIGSATTLLRIQPTLRLVVLGKPKPSSTNPHSPDALHNCRCLSSGTHEHIQIDNDNSLFQFYERMIFSQRMLLWSQPTQWQYVSLLTASPSSQYGIAPPCVAQKRESVFQDIVFDPEHIPIMTKYSVHCSGTGTILTHEKYAARRLVASTRRRKQARQVLDVVAAYAFEQSCKDVSLANGARRGRGRVMRHGVRQPFAVARPS